MADVEEDKRLTLAKLLEETYLSDDIATVRLRLAHFHAQHEYLHDQARDMQKLQIIKFLLSPQEQAVLMAQTEFLIVAHTAIEHFELMIEGHLNRLIAEKK